MWLVPSTRRSEALSSISPTPARVFEDFLNDWPVRSSLLRTEPFTSLFAGTDIRMPAVNILEKDGSLVLQAELPGWNEKDIEVKLEGNVLTLKGERKLHDEEKKNYHRMESFYGSFTRSFTLPETVQPDKIKAEYKNGILTVTIPQKPEVRPRAIPVAVH